MEAGGGGIGRYERVAYTGPAETRLTRPMRYLCRNLLEEENQKLAHKLHDRVRLLRSLSIEIGAEVRHQNRVLDGLDVDLNQADSVLHKTMARVVRLARHPQHYYFVFVLVLSVACFAIIWCVLRYQ